MMINHYKKHLICFAFLFCSTTHAYAKNPMTITDGYIKASIPGSDITAAYMTISNTSDKAISITKITSEISDRIEIHEHNMVNNMMRMRQINQITLKANSHVVLQPSGLHLMLFSVKQKITEKKVISLTLELSNETKMNIQLPVRPYK